MQVDEDTVSIAQVERVIAGIVRDYEGRGECAMLSQVGAGLRTRLSDFDVRAFGYSKLSTMVGDMPRFELVGSGSTTSVTLAGANNQNAAVGRFVRKCLKAAEGHQMPLSKMRLEVDREFPRFNLKGTGYVQFWRFVDSIKGVELVDPDHQLARLVG